MTIKRVDLRSVRHGPQLGLADLIAREHKRVERLTRERNKLQRKLERARVRYSVLKRLANDASRRELGAAQ